MPDIAQTREAGRLGAASIPETAAVVKLLVVERSGEPGAAVLLVAGAGESESVSAQEPGPAALLAEMCGTCHGPDGRSPGAIPSLAPLNAEALRVFLVAYRAGDIEATVMDRIARALTDAEIEALARHFGNMAE